MMSLAQGNKAENENTLDSKKDTVTLSQTEALIVESNFNNFNEICRYHRVLTLKWFC
jgi:hypothetical protein